MDKVIHRGAPRLKITIELIITGLGGGRDTEDPGEGLLERRLDKISVKLESDYLSIYLSI